MQSSKTATASALAQGPSRARYGHGTASGSSSRPQRGSCWVSSGALGSVGTAAMTSGSSGGWEAEAAVCAVSTSWPKWSGSSWDVQLADSTLPLWNAATGTSECDGLQLVHLFGTDSYTFLVATVLCHGHEACRLGWQKGYDFGGPSLCYSSDMQAVLQKARVDSRHVPQQVANGQCK